MRKKIITITLGFLLCIIAAQAHEALIIHPVGGLPQGIELNEIRSIDFSNPNSMVVNVRTGVPVSFALNDVEKLIFGNMPGGTINVPQVNSIDLSVYVTPQGEVHITGGVQVLSITVFDTNGRQLMSSNSDRMNISSLPRAVYLLVIETTQGFATQKIIKQ